METLRILIFLNCEIENKDAPQNINSVNYWRGIAKFIT